MSLVIRMARAGTKKRPFYHIVLADSRSPRDGRFIERLGYYNPLLPKDKEERLKLDLDKVKAWMVKGAQPSDRVSRFHFTALHDWFAGGSAECGAGTIGRATRIDIRHPSARGAVGQQDLRRRRTRSPLRKSPLRCARSARRRHRVRHRRARAEAHQRERGRNDHGTEVERRYFSFIQRHASLSDGRLPYMSTPVR